MLSKIFSSFRFSLLYKNWIQVIVIVSLYQSLHFMSKTATFTLFNTPIPAISQILQFRFKPEYFENVANVLISALMGFLSVKKKQYRLDPLNRNKCAQRY